MKKAEEALESMSVNTIKDWKISTAYYAMYFSLYAILARLGVKCEIHACTLEFAANFLKSYLSETEIEFLKDSLRARVDAQYYVDRKVPDVQYDSMIKQAPEILVKCKLVVLQLNESKINEIRQKLKAEMK